MLVVAVVIVEGVEMTEPKATNIKWHDGLLRREHREELLGQRGCVVWFTGLSGSGKSTVARALEARLIQEGHFAYVLDGDNVRYGLNRDLGFSAEDRKENVRRCAEVAHLFADAGVVAITAFISPYRAERDLARELAGDRPFLEVHVDTDISVCEQRDVKGLYAKARAGEITGFTGIDDPYQAPLAPEIRIDTARRGVEECVDEIVSYVHARDVLHIQAAQHGGGI